MKQGTFTKGDKRIRVTALDSAGMGFIANLICSGWYTDEEAFDLCYQYEGHYVSIEEL